MDRPKGKTGWSPRQIVEGGLLVLEAEKELWGVWADSSGLSGLKQRMQLRKELLNTLRCPMSASLKLPFLNSSS